jgi:glycosyltransferase involved in cell wall biosynthesis
MKTDIPLSELPADKQGTLILHVNGRETLIALKRLDYLRGRSWRVIGYWAWELPTFPPGWERSFALVSEIWTLSPYAKESLCQHHAAPTIHSFPIAVSPPFGVGPDRPRLGMTAGVFTVLIMADTLSSFGRKNPLGAIQAFRAAFGERRDCELIVKTRNLESRPAAERALREAVGEGRNIRIIDAALTDHDKWSLLASVDALLALHRAEGFGLVCAEAMALGKPVIATGWSGNMSFMTEETGLLVRFDLVPVEDPFGVYDKSSWAQPDLQHAAMHLRRLRNDSAFASRIGKSAKHRIGKICDPNEIGTKMAAALAMPPGAGG